MTSGPGSRAVRVTGGALLMLAAAIGGVAILAFQGEREEARRTGVTVVPGGFAPPGALVADGERAGRAPFVAKGAGQGVPVDTSAPAQPESAQAWGPPGVWATPAEFAPSE